MALSPMACQGVPNIGSGKPCLEDVMWPIPPITKTMAEGGLGFVIAGIPERVDLLRIFISTLVRVQVLIINSTRI